MKGASRSRGFSLLEVLATLAIIAIIAAVISPSLVISDEQEAASSTVGILKSVETAVLAIKASAVSSYPYRISHLGNRPLSTDSTACTGRAPSTSLVTFGGTASNWQTGTNGGPFFYRIVSAKGGLPTPFGAISDSMIRTSANNAAGTVDEEMRNVLSERVYMINAIVDGAAEVNSSTSNKVRWTTSNGSSTMTYRIPVVNTC